MAKKFPIIPLHPERLCWGCDRYCAADSMMCGNGSVRTPHPSELFGDDWAQWECGAPSREASPEPPRTLENQDFPDCGIVLSTP